MNKRRMWSMVLVLAMLLCAGKGVAVSAAQMESEAMKVQETQETAELSEAQRTGMPRYKYTSSLTSDVVFIDGVAYVAGDVVGYEGMTTQIYGYLYLQKKSGSSWTNVRTWNKSEGDFSLVVSGSASGLSAGTYRARFVAYVYSGSDYEVATFESSATVYNP